MESVSLYKGGNSTDDNKNVKTNASANNNNNEGIDEKKVNNSSFTSEDLNPSFVSDSKSTSPPECPVGNDRLEDEESDINDLDPSHYIEKITFHDLMGGSSKPCYIYYCDSDEASLPTEILQRAVLHARVQPSPFDPCLTAFGSSKESKKAKEMKKGYQIEAQDQHGKPMTGTSGQLQQAEINDKESQQLQKLQGKVERREKQQREEREEERERERNEKFECSYVPREKEKASIPNCVFNMNKAVITCKPMKADIRVDNVELRYDERTPVHSKKSVVSETDMTTKMNLVRQKDRFPTLRFSEKSINQRTHLHVVGFQKPSTAPINPQILVQEMKERNDLIRSILNS